MLYMQKRRRQFYGEKKDPSIPKLTPSYLTDGFNEFIVKEAGLLMEYYIPKHWLTFQKCCLPINDRFKEGL